MNIKKIKFGIIGGGVMGEVIVRSLRQKLKISSNNILVMDLNVTKRNKLARKYKVKTTKEYEEIICHSKVIFLAVKPQQFKQIAVQLAKKLSNDQIVVSIMAGINLISIQKRLAHKKVVRTMPSMAAQIGEAVTLWMSDKSVKQSDRKIVIDVITSFGMEVEVKSDKKIDALTLVTGSGPAYIFYLAEILENFTKKQGLSSTITKKIVTQMMEGALKLYSQSNDKVSVLRKKVSSKGGITEAMFDTIIKKYKSDKIWAKAFDNALIRSSLIKKKNE